MKAHFANALWVTSSLAEWQHFTHAAEHLAKTQEQLLSHYLRSNANTEYGVKYGFASITSPKQYQSRVSLTAYDDYIAYTQHISDGFPMVLTSEPVRMFELSSGSTHASKLIPYTARLKAEFQRGIAAWIFNLYTHIPKIQGGTAYWSVTPLTGGKQTTSGGIPIGFESDSAYLSPLGRWLISAIMAVPDSVKYFADVNTFRYATLLNLLLHPDLRLISVWNPTFLTLLLAPLPDWWDSLIHDIAVGKMKGPHTNLDVLFRFAPNPSLASRLRYLTRLIMKSIWPELTLISCWMDGPSTPYAYQIAEKFPHVIVQGKGLLATEAFVSFPLAGLEGGVLAANSHFFEFIDESGEALLAHQLCKSKIYSVVVTTGGGLYRYQLHDMVEVIGYWKQLPRLRFIGKADHISDWFGEKLEEHFVARVLQNVFLDFQITPNFAMLAPEETQEGMCYILYLDSNAHFNTATFALAINSALRANFHYDYCRKLGQLDSVQVVRIINGAETYLRACQMRGQKLGNIKSSVLQKTIGWHSCFELQGSE